MLFVNQSKKEKQSEQSLQGFHLFFSFSLMGDGRKISELLHLYWFCATSSQTNGPLWILPVLQMVSLLCNSALGQINVDPIAAKMLGTMFLILNMKNRGKKLAMV